MKAKILQGKKVVSVNLKDMNFDTTMDFNLLNILIMSDLDPVNLLVQCSTSLLRKLKVSGYMRNNLTPKDQDQIISNMKTILSLYNVARMYLDLPKEEQVFHIQNLMKKMEDSHVYETICEAARGEKR